MTWEPGKKFIFLNNKKLIFFLCFRIDDLEKSISDLMTQAGVEGHQIGGPPLGDK